MIMSAGTDHLIERNWDLASGNSNDMEMLCNITVSQINVAPCQGTGHSSHIYLNSQWS